MTSRRQVLKVAAGGLVLAGSGGFARLAQAGLPAGAVEAGVLEAMPGKQPLIRRSFRPPNYETPIAYFGDVINADRDLFTAELSLSQGYANCLTGFVRLYQVLGGGWQVR